MTPAEATELMAKKHEVGYVKVCGRTRTNIMVQRAEDGTLYWADVPAD